MKSQLRSEHRCEPDRPHPQRGLPFGSGGGLRRHYLDGVRFLFALFLKEPMDEVALRLQCGFQGTERRPFDSELLIAGLCQFREVLEAGVQILFRLDIEFLGSLFKSLVEASGVSLPSLTA